MRNRGGVHLAAGNAHPVPENFRTGNREKFSWRTHARDWRRTTEPVSFFNQKKQEDTTAVPHGALPDRRQTPGHVTPLPSTAGVTRQQDNLLNIQYKSLRRAGEAVSSLVGMEATFFVAATPADAVHGWGRPEKVLHATSVWQHICCMQQHRRV